MSRDDADRLRDIQDAIAAINEHVTRADRGDPLLHDALLFQCVVIGEAVKNLAEQTRDAAPEIPWTSVAGLRDLIAHEYFRVDIDRVLAVVEHDLPPLLAAIERILGERP